MNKLVISLLPLCWLAGCSSNLSAVVPLHVPGVTRMAIWRTRAFLCAPTLSSALLETPWQPGLPTTAARVRRFPALSPAILCHALQAPLDLQTDPFGRLWVLDGGSEHCPPQVLIYDLLLYSLGESHRHELAPGTPLTILAVDGGSSRAVSTAYLAGGERLVVFSLALDRSWQVETNLQGSITSMILSKGAPYFRSSLLLEVDHVAVFQIPTDNLQGAAARAERLGELLGASSAGLLSDRRGGVLYVLGRDCAALRWRAELPLEAESHDVLLQDCLLLRHVTQLVRDAAHGVWALGSNGTTQHAAWCVRLTD